MITDALGQEINIGDTVLTTAPYYHGLYKGTVIKLYKKQVEIEGKATPYCCGKTFKRTGADIIKIKETTTKGE